MIEALQHRFSVSEKRHTLPLNRKVMGVHGLKLVVAASVIGICSYYTLHMGAFLLSKTVQIVGLLLLGAWHAAQLQKPESYLNALNDQAKWGLTIGVSALMVIFLLLLRFFQIQFHFLTGVAGAASFVLPLLVYETWLLYVGTTQKYFPPWHLPLGIFDKRATIFLNSITITVKVAGSFFYPEETLLVSTGPARMQLGRLFHRMVVKQNSGSESVIGLLDEAGQFYAWTFYAEGYKGFEQRVLDPEATLIKNRLKDGSIIVATRVKAPRALPATAPDSK